MKTINKILYGICIISVIFGAIAILVLIWQEATGDLLTQLLLTSITIFISSSLLLVISLKMQEFWQKSKNTPEQI